MFHESIEMFERIVGWILEEKRKYFGIQKCQLSMKTTGSDAIML